MLSRFGWFVIVAPLIVHSRAVAQETAVQTPAESATHAASAVGADATTWSDDTNGSRLLLGPTARSLKRGESYLDLVGMTLPLVQVGLTDRVSFGAGTALLIPGLRPGDAVWLTPKVQLFETRRTAAAVGLAHIVLEGRRHDGLAYAVVTHGSKDAAFTVGAGVFYDGWLGRGGGAPVLLLGGEKRVSDRVKVISENYLGSRAGLISGGVRLIRRRTSWDFGLGRNIGFGGEGPPWGIVRFAWRFSPPSRDRE